MEETLSLELIEQEGCKGRIIDVSHRVIKEYFIPIYDMWEAIGGGCLSISIYLHIHGFTTEEFMVVLEFDQRDASLFRRTTIDQRSLLGIISTVKQS